jgi:hypothetical protein
VTAEVGVITSNESDVDSVLVFAWIVLSVVDDAACSMVEMISAVVESEGKVRIVMTDRGMVVISIVFSLAESVVADLIIMVKTPVSESCDAEFTAVIVIFGEIVDNMVAAVGISASDE